jgi:phosphoribosylamine--glycine ligase
MIVLLVGSGGREHALAWKLKQSPALTRLVIAPGSAGMSGLGELRAVRADDVEGLTALSREIRADLVVVGPEAALEGGLADRLAEAGVPCFGPTAAAARLESSKAFTKDFATRFDIPTAGYGVFTDTEAAVAALERFQPPYVIKADGLAAGKGVVIADERAEAEREIAAMLGGRFGQAGARVVIEEFMAGEEASLFALCDGRPPCCSAEPRITSGPSTGDAGPNTGGMGTYSPRPC